MEHMIKLYCVNGRRRENVAVACVYKQDPFEDSLQGYDIPFSLISTLNFLTGRLPLNELSTHLREIDLAVRLTN